MSKAKLYEVYSIDHDILLGTFEKQLGKPVKNIKPLAEDDDLFITLINQVSSIKIPFPFGFLKLVECNGDDRYRVKGYNDDRYCFPYLTLKEREQLDNKEASRLDVVMAAVEES